MDVFPGAYVAKLAITAAVMIGALVITALSSRLKSIASIPSALSPIF
jgi:hypothetical protein